ncbi:MAG: DUF3047 domain-containing protein [Pseudomonadota bacterium]
MLRCKNWTLGALAAAAVFSIAASGGKAGNPPAAAPALAAEQEAPAARAILDNLSSSKVGKFPHKWRTWPLQRGKAEEVYSVAEENGSRYIKAYDDHDASQQIFLNFDWQIDRSPILSWRWRATTLPPGASEAGDATNDSACGVYVIVGRYDGHAIKYVWSSTLPAGATHTRHDGKLKIKVLDSGASGKGKWVRHRVDIPADYEALFGRKLDKNPSGVAILTDGNAVHKPSGCDYADFAVSGK